MAEQRQEFQRELEAIEAKVIELFAMVAEDLPAATQALLTGNNEALQLLAERDRVIDALYAEIEELVNREILLQAPVASDLRFLLSVLRIVPELERSHDLVVEIARLADHILSEDLSPRSRGLIERMGNLASDMWRQAADAWYERDRSAAFRWANATTRWTTSRQPDSRAGLGANGAAGDDGDDAGGAASTSAWGPRRQHRPPGGLPRRIPGPAWHAGRGWAPDRGTGVRQPPHLRL